ncbi:MAG: hypothetical protein MHM6MM_008270, partial [Cercozoa sp. M6MM]
LFDQFKLPVSVKFGFVQKLTIQLPGFTPGVLRTAPVVVEIDGVYALVRPALSSDTEHEEKEQVLARKRLNVKRQLLHEHDQLWLQQHPEIAQSEASFWDGLAQAVVRNLRLHVGKVHLRYEDTSCALGVLLDALHAAPDNEDVQDEAQKVVRTVKLDGLRVYCDTRFQDQYNTLEDFENNHANEHMWVLPPLQLHSRLVWQRVDPRDHKQRPRFAWSTRCEKLQLRCTKQQLALLKSFAEQQQVRKAQATVGAAFRQLAKHRPECRPSEDARAWWRYACRCVRTLQKRAEETHDLTFSLTEEGLAEWRRTERRYTELCLRWRYATTLALSPLSEEEREEWQRLSDALSVAHAVHCRRSADRRADVLRRRQQLQHLEKQAQVGWWGWLTGGPTVDTGDGSVADTTDGAVTDGAVTDGAVAVTDGAVSDESDQAAQYLSQCADVSDLLTQLPDDFVLLRLALRLDHCAVLVLGEHETQDEVIALKFGGRAAFTKRPRGNWALEVTSKAGRLESLRDAVTASLQEAFFALEKRPRVTRVSTDGVTGTEDGGDSEDGDGGDGEDDQPRWSVTARVPSVVGRVDLTQLRDL